MSENSAWPWATSALPCTTEAFSAARSASTCRREVFTAPVWASKSSTKAICAAGEGRRPPSPCTTQSMFCCRAGTDTAAVMVPFMASSPVAMTLLATSMTSSCVGMARLCTDCMTPVGAAARVFCASVSP